MATCRRNRRSARNTIITLFFCIKSVTQAIAGVDQKNPARPTGPAGGRQIITVGYNHVPPDTMNIDGNAAGPANEFLKRVIQRMGYDVRFKYLPLARLISQANSNQLDMINRIGANPALKIKPTVPFTATSPGILVAKRSGVKNWSQLAAKKNFRIGTKIGMPLTDHMKTQTAKLLYQPGTRALENSVLMTKHGRLDGVYSPALSELVVMANEFGILDDFVPIKLPDKPWSVYVAFSPDAHEKFHDAYVKALAEEQKIQPYNRVYASFLRSYFPRMGSDVLPLLFRDAN